MSKTQSTHSIGDGFLSTGNRVYDQVNKKMVLSTWTQKKCVICNSFLTKFQRKFCSKHGVGSKEYFEFNKENYHRDNKNWREKNHEYDLQRHQNYNQKRKVPVPFLPVLPQK